MLDPAHLDRPPQAITNNTVADGFPKLSPDGRRIIFESTRLVAAGERANVSDLFLIETDCIVDGTCESPVHLLRGAGASWSPDGKKIAFHASQSGSAVVINTDPGAPAVDSDIFVVDVGDFLAGVATPTNLTNNGATTVDDDPDWSNDGTQIVYTRHSQPSSNPLCGPDPVTQTAGNCPYPDARVMVMNADGTGTPKQLQDPDLEIKIEERAPAWSPVAQKILFLCRIVVEPPTDFEVCTMNADGTNRVWLTNNTAQDLTGAWSPDGTQIVVQRNKMTGQGNQLFLMNPNSINDPGTNDPQITAPGSDTSCLLRAYFPHWGYVRSVMASESLAL